MVPEIWVTQRLERRNRTLPPPPCHRAAPRGLARPHGASRGALEAPGRARTGPLGEYTGLIRSKNWEAASGFVLTDEMRLLIAAQAALLILGLSFDHYREVGAIIVHPTTVVLTGERGSSVPGLMTDAPMPILGEAAHKGPILIAWDAVAMDVHHPERGHNVVFHEFAHKIDMLDDVVDGTPPMARSEIDRWVQVCTARVREGPARR
ncbi:MAG: zinc-dependent peptidase [Microthrixaceae bacterium]